VRHDLRHRPTPALVALLGLLATTALLRLTVDHPPSGGLGLAWPEPGWARYRWTALAVGLAAGGGLGLAGLLLQSLLRNPLASPYVLGASSGAGLGVMLSLYAAWRAGVGGLGPVATAPAALAGGLGALGLVLLLSGVRGRFDPLTLLLVGVVVSTLCGAGILLVQHLVPTGLRGEFLTWLMGHVPQAADPGAVLLAGLVTLAALAIAMALARPLDAGALGEDEARSLGVPVTGLRLAGFLLAGLLTAAAVSLTGPVGFVGLIAPHVARALVGPHHRWAAPASTAAGALLLVGADVLGQAWRPGGGQVPPGVFTALAGGPVFLAILLGRSRLATWGPE